MPDTLPISEPLLRFGSFALIFALMAGLEILHPRRVLTGSKSHRWATNAGMLVAATATARVLGQFAGPLVAVGMAGLAATHGWGVLNLVNLPEAIELIAAIVALDLAIWFQHVISHKVPFLWRMHRVHHADRDIDLTTALRFHPFEIVLSMVYKAGIVLLLGPAVWAVILFEIILNGSAMFNHANVRLPAALDRGLRAVIVTPDMHRVHHSIHRAEHDTNFGFFFSVWDRVFGTYTPEPREGHMAMKIGLPATQSDLPDGLIWSLGYPFQTSSAKADQ
ncbi:MAG: sterol desaturase family protein [Pseudomonadota bacterium]